MSSSARHNKNTLYIRNTQSSGGKTDQRVVDHTYSTTREGSTPTFCRKRKDPPWIQQSGIHTISVFDNAGALVQGLCDLLSGSVLTCIRRRAAQAYSVPTTDQRVCKGLQHSAHNLGSNGLAQSVEMFIVAWVDSTIVAMCLICCVLSLTYSGKHARQFSGFWFEGRFARRILGCDSFRWIQLTGPGPFFFFLFSFGFFLLLLRYI